MYQGKRLKVMTIFGTRPEAIKMAPVVLALKTNAKYFDTIVTVTAQHREMLDQVLKLFAISPDYDLDIMSKGQTLFDITTKALEGLKAVLLQEVPDLVLVHGDTTTTFAGALSAYYQEIKVAHIEAGLRTGNKYSPFPEEMNRKLTAALSDLHFAPTLSARENLLREGIAVKDIFVTGNTVIDALHMQVSSDFHFADDVLARLDYQKKRIILLTTHRRENLGEPMRHVYRAMKRILDSFSDTELVFPVHKNPRVREVVAEELGKDKRVHLIDPLDYAPFANLMHRSYLILTDSGGVQEEAPSLGKPVLVLRDTTERPEALKAGTVRLVGTKEEDVFQNASELLMNSTSYRKMSEAINPYGDGRATQRILDTILYHYGFSENLPKGFAYEK